MPSKEKRVAKELEELFEAAGSVHAYPVINGGTELAPEELSALECGMSTALVVATELAKGGLEGQTSEEIAIRMKVGAVSMYVESVVLAEEEQEGEAPEAIGEE